VVRAPGLQKGSGLFPIQFETSSNLSLKPIFEQASQFPNFRQVYVNKPLIAMMPHRAVLAVFLHYPLRGRVSNG
jgi:hypothetical protein